MKKLFLEFIQNALQFFVMMVLICIVLVPVSLLFGIAISLIVRAFNYGYGLW